jgi:FKBP-type peptidyl-prolyl cis-trans isomerase
MNTKIVLATIILIAGFAAVFIFSSNTVVNQRVINFESFLKNTSTDNLEKLEAPLTDIITETIKEPADNDSKAVITGDKIRVNYRGWLASNGTIFDQSFTRGDSGFVFIVGSGVIEGWSKGVVGMKVGEVRRLKVPYALGYGDAGNPPAIPEKSDLIFDVELIEFVN